jgi:transcriptional regulator with XRE-family HTH domain
MSELSGISRVQISYYETSDQVPTMATFNKWLTATTSEIRRIRVDRSGANARKNKEEG